MEKTKDTITLKDLTKEEMRRVIDGKRQQERIPNVCAFWMPAENFEGKVEEMREWLDRQVYDMDVLYIQRPGLEKGTEEDPEYCFMPAEYCEEKIGACDAKVYLEDWEDTDLVEEMYAKFPSADSPSLFLPDVKLDHSKYIVGQWFFWLFERHWSLRGMENALTDFYLYPEEVHRLYQRLTDYYIRVVERAKLEYDIDAIFTSDDIGTQHGPFFSLEIFRTFFKPYYKQLIDKVHELGMHFWLHACGNVELFLEDFIEIGLDVIHPLQKYTMDEKRIVEKYGGRICFLVGFDVQRIIPFGSPEEVRQEVRFLVNTFAREDGRFIMTMGNGATKDWKKESLEALYEELIRAEETLPW